MEPPNGCRLSRSPGKLVDELGTRCSRSRHVLYLVPHSLAVRAGAPGIALSSGESAPTEVERKLMESVSGRVRLWTETSPYYNESSGPGKIRQSRGTESVLNALILMTADPGHGSLNDLTREALRHMWPLQEKTGEQKGAWPWLDFGNEPFEARDSTFYGAALAAVAVSETPPAYRANPERQDNLRLLADYIRREFSRSPVVHQAVALWAYTRWRDLLSPIQVQSIVDKILREENPDGGWGLASTGWTWKSTTLRSALDLWIRSNDTPLAGKSDGYATGLIVFTLQQLGNDHAYAASKRGRTWLLANQNRAEGFWPGYSMVNRRDPSNGTGRFMNDAATAYAVLALTPP